MGDSCMLGWEVLRIQANLYIDTVRLSSTIRILELRTQLNAQLGLPRWLMLPGAGENQLGLGKEVL